MRAIAQGGVSGVTFPVLELIAIDPSDGVLKDVNSATFEIKDKDGATTEGPTAVNVISDRVGRGRYAAAWTVPATELIGNHTIIWSYDFVVAGPTATYSQLFEVLDVVAYPLARRYTTVDQLREEEVKPARYKAARLQHLIQLASEYIEMFTGSVFEPVGKVLSVDGGGSGAMLLDEPIIAIGDVTIDTSPFSPSDVDIDPSLFRVYNRHISQGLLHPDDRDSPKIEFFNTSRGVKGLASFSFSRMFFPSGQQNVHLEGVFGYTDPNGLDLLGSTPFLINHVAKLLVIRNLPPLSKTDDRDELKRGHLIEELRTRDQQIKYNFPAGRSTTTGAFTGDPEIDTILSRFMRPIPMAST